MLTSLQGGTDDAASDNSDLGMGLFSGTIEWDEEDRVECQSKEKLVPWGEVDGVSVGKVEKPELQAGKHDNLDGQYYGHCDHLQSVDNKLGGLHARVLNFA